MFNLNKLFYLLDLFIILNLKIILSVKDNNNDIVQKIRANHIHAFETQVVCMRVYTNTHKHIHMRTYEHTINAHNSFSFFLNSTKRENSKIPKIKIKI